jgi:N-acetylneuraminic acid mutarotase
LATRRQPFNVPRIFHTATLLTNGTVLIAGGQSAEEIGQSSTEIYNPSTNQWTLGASLLQGRDSHSATLLPDGRVLVAGGEGECPDQHGLCVLASAEIYDSATNQWSMTGHMHVRRENHTATLLPNGQVLVVGGTNALAPSQYKIAVCELYDPSAGTWSVTGEMSVRRSEFTANLLPNGQVLVAGGGGTKTSAMLVPRESHASALLPEGQVLIMGGTGKDCTPLCNVLGSAEIYDPNTGAWTAAPSMHRRRWARRATTLPSGLVLVEGGVNTEAWDAPPMAEAETYQRAPDGN